MPAPYARVLAGPSYKGISDAVHALVRAELREATGDEEPTIAASLAARFLSTLREGIATCTLVVDGVEDAPALERALRAAGVTCAALRDSLVLVERRERLEDPPWRAVAPAAADAVTRAWTSYEGGPQNMVWGEGSVLPLRLRAQIMGIVNVTPDSFSDGGRFLDAHDAIKHAMRLIDEGADILDIGGESSRPGAEPVDAAEEIARVAPVIEALAGSGVPISVDTTKAAVARAALDVGAAIVNDVSAGRSDPDMLPLVAERGVPYVLMHMRGEPRTMQHDPRYADVVGEVHRFLAERAEAAVTAGVAPGHLIVDPGFGFGKSVEHNLVLLRRLRELTSLGFPVLAGTSRKSFIGATLDLPVDERLEGTAATVALAVINGASILRVHDVAGMRRVAGMVEAVLGAADTGEA